MREFRYRWFRSPCMDHTTLWSHAQSTALNHMANMYCVGIETIQPAAESIGGTNLSLAWLRFDQRLRVARENPRRIESGHSITSMIRAV